MVTAKVHSSISKFSLFMQELLIETTVVNNKMSFVINKMMVTETCIVESLIDLTSEHAFAICLFNTLEIRKMVFPIIFNIIPIFTN